MLVANHRDNHSIATHRTQHGPVVASDFAQRRATHDCFVVVATPKVPKAKTMADFVDDDALAQFRRSRDEPRFIHTYQTMIGVRASLCPPIAAAREKLTFDGEGGVPLEKRKGNERSKHVRSIAGLG